MMLRHRFLIILAYILLNSCRSSIGKSDQNAKQNSIIYMMCSGPLENNACFCYIDDDYNIQIECNRMRVSRLKVMNLYASSLPSNFFDNLITLESIELDDNVITELPKRLFSKFNQLNTFNISRSFLQTISDDLFTNHSQIEQINFSHNQISILPEDFLSGARNLKILDLSYNLLKKLPERIFHTLHKLETLELNDNRLTSISESQFVGTPNLIELDLSSNLFITKKWVNSFGDHNSSNNVMRSLPANCFRGLYKLKTLRIQRAGLSSLPNNLFDNTTEISEIRLSNNELQQLPKGIFDYTKKLEMIDLSNNTLKTLQPDIFQHTQQLYSLMLVGNEFVSYDFIEFLILKPMNHLKIFDSDITHRIQKIDLSDNRIDAFYFPKNIYDYNNNYSLPKIIINLSGNPLKSDCLRDTIDLLSKTVDIRVDVDNSCTRGNHLFCPIPKDVETDCTFLVRNSDRMMKIDCSNVGMKETQNQLKMPSKKLLDYFNISKCELDIQNNEIEILPKFNQPQFECVQSINARNNSIKSIQVENLSENLKLLDISHNKIKTLDGEIIERLRNLKDTRLILKENNWDCECDFRRFIRDNFERFDLKNITCADGIPLNDKRDLCVWEILFTIHDLLPALIHFIFHT